MARMVVSLLLALSGASAFSSTPMPDDVDSLPTSYRFIINSCGDIAGPTMAATIAANGLQMAARVDDMVRGTSRAAGPSRSGYMATPMDILPRPARSAPRFHPRE